MWKIIIALLVTAPVWAAEPLSLQQAVQKALENHASVRVTAEAKKAAEAKITEARGARLPRVDYTESWQRSNNPGFVFSSLLSQRQFGAENFAIGPLNNPPYVNNFQSQFVAEQSIYDGGRSKSQVRTAELGRDMVDQEGRRNESSVIANVVRTYYGVLVARENARVAEEAVRSAEADLKRAQEHRDAGMTTDADVLSIRVHLASMQEQKIRRDADSQLAVAALNEAMGLPLDTDFDLTTMLATAAPPAADRVAAENDAVANRPELAEARLGVSIRESEGKTAHSAYLPEFYIRAAWEADRPQFYNNGGANWLTAAGMRWNLFRGFSDKARMEAASHEIARSRAEQQLMESSVRLEARRAWLDVQSANQRIDVARASVDNATESLRIIRNRYEAGFTDVTELLRAETALLQAQTQQLEAVRDQRIAAVMLEYTRGTLSKDSDILSGK
jgi:outer membrane protein